MNKEKWKPSTLLNPVPVVLVTCQSKKGKPNIMTVAWAGTVNSEPPMLSISIRKERFSHALIRESGVFVVNLPTAKLLRAVDFCGVRSGKQLDKFKETGLTPVASANGQVPFIRECPVNIECAVHQVVELGSHDLFIAKIMAVHVDKTLINRQGRLCLEKAGLIAFSHGQYIELGRVLGGFGFSVAKKKHCVR
ncbi:MAG: flavin reductase [Elusimicrobia bacterium RIFOXYB2_FULL_49_7]|nr:MAG: flavin reductase [Elusimicrobia bacterium RIFOXYB2_FULL_49_7]